jgi:hypothetical protein
MIIFRNFSKFFSVLGQIMAFVTIIMIGLIYLSEAINIPFIEFDFIEKMKSIKEYAVIITLTVCAFSFACKRSIFIFVPFCLLAVCALACYSIVLFR